MLRLALVAPLAALALPLAPRADPPRAEGRIETEDAHVEILGRPVPVGQRIDLPEGWFRVEEAGTEDGQVGSFSVVPAEALAEADAPAAPEVAAADDPSATPASRDCRTERAAYLAELWHESGIEVRRPDALIEGLEGPDRGAALGFQWFALATDPFRPLAWSSELRGRADALARCVQGN